MSINELLIAPGVGWEWCEGGGLIVVVNCC